MPSKTNDREYRSLVLSAADEPDKMIVRGFATTFSQPYRLWSDDDVELREQVLRSAFDETDMADVIMQYDHTGRVFARRRNGTLRLEVTDEGLAIEADLGGTDIGRQLYEEIRGGYTDKMSYGYTLTEDGADEEYLGTENGRKIYLRTVKKIAKLYDVSAVSLPANDNTSISARSAFDGVIERVTAERLEAQRIETERLRTIVRARAKGVKNDY